MDPKIGQNSRFCVSLASAKMQVFKTFFEQHFFLCKRLPLVKILAISNHIYEIKGPKSPRKGLFHGS